MSRGYLFLALGKRYIDEVYNLVKTIDINGDTNPKSIVCFKEDGEYAKSLNVFDRIIEFKTCELFNECQNSFEKYCLYPRLNFKNYLVYDETIVLDSDMLCTYQTNSVWDWLSNQSRDIGMLGYNFDPKWHWNNWFNICQLNGFKMPHTHGGFFYFRKDSDILDSFFSYAKEAFLNYDKLHFLKLYRGGRVDEPCFAYAHAKVNLLPIEFTEFPIMTFQLSHEHERKSCNTMLISDIPTKLQTNSNINVTMNDYIPFIHMFGGKDGDNYINLYNKIMSK